MSRKTAFHGSAAGRRRAQRSHLQNPQALSSERLHRPTPSRAQLEEYKRQIARATIVYQQEFSHHYAQPGTWLCHRAIYALGLQKRKKITAK